MIALLALVLDSALRSLILGGAVLLLLKVLRLKDCAAETVIWTAVLVAALGMPGLTVALPGLPLPLPAMAAAPHVEGRPAGGPDVLTLLAAAALWIYGLGVLAFMARLILGLGLTARLYLTAQPVDQPWADGLKVRTSADIASPVSFADCILLPEDCWRWPRKTLEAALAHEQAHIRRGDFFICLLASLNRAVFWFNPFAWWLVRRLSVLAERASDRAAAARIEDSVGYAEILMQAARRTRAGRWTNLASGPAMARGPGVARRIDELLADAPEQVLAAPARLAALASVTLAALMIAALHAAPQAAAAPFASVVQRQALLVQAVDRLAAPAPATPRPSKPAGSSRAAGRPRLAETRAAQAAPEVQPAVRRYDPRALIEDPQAAALPALLTTQSGRVILVPELSAGAARGDEGTR